MKIIVFQVSTTAQLTIVSCQEDQEDVLQIYSFTHSATLFKLLRATQYYGEGGTFGSRGLSSAYVLYNINITCKFIRRRTVKTDIRQCVCRRRKNAVYPSKPVILNLFSTTPHLSNRPFFQSP